MEKSRDYDWLIKRAQSHKFADCRLVENYGKCIQVMLADDEEAYGIRFSANFEEVVRLATGWIFEGDDVPAFDRIDIDATYRRIGASPDFLSETLMIVAESFRTWIFEFVNGTTRGAAS